jgi:hypothetical protein
MKVSMQIYGEQAKTLAKELGNKSAELPMTAHFTFRDVEGRTVVSALFDSEETIGKLAEFVNQGVTQAASDEAKAAFAVVKSRMEILGLTKEAQVTSTEKAEPADCGGNEEQQETFQRLERRFDACREARGY